MHTQHTHARKCVHTHTHHAQLKICTRNHILWALVQERQEKPARSSVPQRGLGALSCVLHLASRVQSIFSGCPGTRMLGLVEGLVSECRANMGALTGTLRHQNTQEHLCLFMRL